MGNSLGKSSNRMQLQMKKTKIGEGKSNVYLIQQGWKEPYVLKQGYNKMQLQKQYQILKKLKQENLSKFFLSPVRQYKEESNGLGSIGVNYLKSYVDLFDLKYDSHHIYVYPKENYPIIEKKLYSILAELHQRNIIHLDIKPENIMIDYEEGENGRRVIGTDVRYIDVGSFVLPNDWENLKDINGNLLIRPTSFTPEFMNRALFFQDGEQTELKNDEKLEIMSNYFNIDLLKENDRYALQKTIKEIFGEPIQIEIENKKYVKVSLQTKKRKRQQQTKTQQKQTKTQQQQRIIHPHKKSKFLKIKVKN